MAKFSKGRRKLSPYQKIMRAYRRQSPCSLSIEDVDILVKDDTIRYKGEMDEEEHEEAPRDYRERT